MHVTVTIPAYRQERFLAAAIESVLAQSHRDLDLIVIDDGSPDGTWDVAQRHASDARVECRRNERNLGLVGNWNRCLDAARGPLVLVLGGDDLLEPGFLEQASRIFEAHAEVGLLHAPVRAVDALGAVVREPAARASRQLAAGDEAVGALLRDGISTVTTVVRRSCYEALGGYDPGIRDTPDIEFTARIAKHHDVYELGDVQGSFRWHSGKWGHLSYLEENCLEIWMHCDRLAWSHLSRSGLEAMGFAGLEDVLARNGARFAFDGALAALAHGRADLSRRYLRHAMRLSPHFWRERRFWQALVLGLVPPLGTRIMRARMTAGD